MEAEDNATEVEEQAQGIWSGTATAANSNHAEIDVGLFRNNGAWCSGTLVRNNIVLTAGHCFQTDNAGQNACIGAGCPAADFGPETVQVRQTRDLTVDNRIVGNVGDYRQHASLDVSIFRLERPFSVNGSTLGHSTQIYTGASSGLNGKASRHSGWGDNTCTPPAVAGARWTSAGAGTQRQEGDTTVDAVTTEHLRYDQGSSTSNTHQSLPGDSGSSFRWTAGSWWNEPIVGVTSYVSWPTMQCPNQTFITASNQFDNWAHNAIGAWSSDVDRGLNSDNFDNFEVIDVADGSSSWSATSSAIVQSSNHGGTVLADRWGTVHSNADIQVTLRSTDNDWQGIAFRYRDSCNFYFMEANEQESTIRVGRYKDCVKTILQSTDVSFDWNNFQTMRVVVQDDNIAGLFNGTWKLWTTDTTFSAGKVGLWSSYQTDARFSSLLLTHLHD